MTLRGVAFIGVRTDAFDATTRLYREVLGLVPYRSDGTSERYRLADGTALHVYGPTDRDHSWFGPGPVVGFLVDDVTATRAHMEADGITFVTQIEKADGDTWCHFRGPDGSLYEILSEG